MLNKLSDLLVQNSLAFKGLSAEDYLKTILSIRKAFLPKSLEKTWKKKQGMGANTEVMIAD